MIYGHNAIVKQKPFSFFSTTVSECGRVESLSPSVDSIAKKMHAFLLLYKVWWKKPLPAAAACKMLSSSSMSQSVWWRVPNSVGLSVTESLDINVWCTILAFVVSWLCLQTYAYGAFDFSFQKRNLPHTHTTSHSMALSCRHQTPLGW